MTRKTVKDLDAELFKLKSEMEDLTKKCDDILKKYECLEKKYEDNVPRKNLEFKCASCDDKFTKMSDLKKHREIHNANVVSFECVNCDDI